MRIIDKRKDYYDSGQIWETEPSIVYIRETIEIQTVNEPNNHNGKFAIGFCGNIYFGYRSNYKSKDQFSELNPKNISVCCYSIDDVDRFYKNHYPKKLNEYNPPKVEHGRSRWKYKRLSLREEIKTWIEDGKYYHTWQCLEPICYPDYFAKYQTPIWIHELCNRVLIINPILRDWEFFKVKDAYTSYNEISNYVGGVLQHPMRPIPEINDETKIELAGFDNIKSFRKGKNHEEKKE